MARTRQLNIRLSPAEMACLQAVRGPRKSQADAVAELVLAECERRCHDHGSAGHEEMAAYYANALWDYDHETGRAWSGRPPTPPPQIQVWNRFGQCPGGRTRRCSHGRLASPEQPALRPWRDDRRPRPPVRTPAA